jgi:hypothetical protein
MRGEVMRGNHPPDSVAPLRIVLDQRQRDLLLKEIPAPDRLLRLIRLAKMQKGQFRVSLTLEQLDELLGCIEDKASQTADQKRQKEMYDLCDALERVALRRISDMEWLRTGAAEIEPPGEYAERSFSGKLTAWNGALLDNMFMIDSMDRPTMRLDIHEMFLKFLQHQGRIPRPEIGGLSWEQMIQVLRCNWDDDNGPMTLCKTLKPQDLQGAKILQKARVLLAGILEAGGVKATVAGNLNRKFVGVMVERMTWPEGYVDHLHLMNKVINEEDVFPLHVVRLLLDLSGLLHMKKGLFSVTRKGEKLVKGDQAGSLYRLLFLAMFRRLDLAYLDGMPPISSLQETIAYSLFMLSKMGMGWMRTDQLAPKLLLEPIRLEMENTRIPVHWFLSSRLFGPLQEFGLLEERNLPEHQQKAGVEEVRKTTLFDEFVSFHHT